MKKHKLFRWLLVLVLLVLFFPIRMVYKDGGTQTYTSLTYKVIVWKRMETGFEMKTGVEVHFFPNNFHDLDAYDEK